MYVMRVPLNSILDFLVWIWWMVDDDENDAMDNSIK